MTIYCWKCHRLLEEEPIGFRSFCPFCHSDLHTCVNCRFYAPGKPNDCSIPGTDPVRDREARNFCEEFRVKESHPTSNNQHKKRFEDLFN